MRRRGLIFWALGLRSFRCRSCHRDLIWRQRTGPPFVCRWCGSFTFDLLAAAARTSAAMAAFARQLEELGRVAQDASLHAQVWSVYASGDQTTLLTPVDLPSKQV